MKKFFVALLMVVSLSGAMMHATTLSAAANCNTRFLTFPTWYDGVVNRNCDLRSPDASQFGRDSDTRLRNYIAIIVMNVIEIMLQLVAYVSIGFIIYGGFMYLTSAGQANRVTSGKKIILNAIIGLVISLFSVAIITIISRNIRG